MYFIARTTFSDGRIEKKSIESLLKEKDDNIFLLIIGNCKLERLHEIKEINSQIHKLMDERKKIFSATNNV